MQGCQGLYHGCIGILNSQTLIIEGLFFFTAVGAVVLLVLCCLGPSREALPYQISISEQTSL